MSKLGLEKTWVWFISWSSSFTSCMKRWRHDGGHPGGFAVGCVELILQVSVEDSHAGGKCQCQSQDKYSGNQHHPAPAAIWSFDCSCYSHGYSAPSFLSPLLQFTIIGLLDFLMVYTVGLLEDLGGLRVEDAITRPADSISLSHFLLGSSGKAPVLVLEGVWLHLLSMSLKLL